MKYRVCLLLFLLFVMLGCGAGGSSDNPSVREDINYETPVVESDFRDVMLEWLPNIETNLAGYRVFMRAKGKAYDYRMWH